MDTIVKKTHPLILIAATSVTLLSLAGTASLLGWLPHKSAETSPPLVTSAPASTLPAKNPDTTLQIPAGTTITVGPSHEPKAAPKVAAAPRPVPRSTSPEPVARAREPYTQREDKPLQRVSSNSADIDVIPASQVCRECGSIEQVREIKAPGEGSGIGAVAGALLGGVLGNQVGGGNGKKLATVAGVVGGAYAGHQIEKTTRSETRYEIVVAMEDGTRKVIPQQELPAWQAGDRVRLENGILSPR